MQRSDGGDTNVDAARLEARATSTQSYEFPLPSGWAAMGMKTHPEEPTGGVGCGPGGPPHIASKGTMARWNA